MVPRKKIAHKNGGFRVGKNNLLEAMFRVTYRASRVGSSRQRAISLKGALLVV